MPCAKYRLYCPNDDEDAYLPLSMRVLDNSSGSAMTPFVAVYKLPSDNLDDVQDLFHDSQLTLSLASNLLNTY